ncbi:MAG TPA: thiamine-phosphate kinase, partial [Dehalococcoidia bacterium]|nr:thiamine-phosphate kinase [Dehalococcoidia bacterium]
DHGVAFECRLLVDTGDDTAAWHTGPATQLFTTDTVVEGVHSTRRTTPWRDLGWKSLAANISDIAAMGGLPLYALVTLGLPPETEIADLDELYRGMLEIGNKYGVGIVGGDLVRSPVVFITVALTGVQRGGSMLRTTARPGDVLAVTGYLGGSSGGLRLMQEQVKASPEATRYLRKVHRRPVPDVAAGQILMEAGVVTAMDISDGLSDDLSKLCLASGVSARIFADRIPKHSLLKEVFPDHYLDLALNGGEDYKLLFTAPPAVMERVMTQLPEGASAIGQITPGEPGRVVIVDSAGTETVAARHGWDHFSGS